MILERKQIAFSIIILFNRLIIFTTNRNTNIVAVRTRRSGKIFVVDAAVGMMHPHPRVMLMID
jgi:hypothetical protein